MKSFFGRGARGLGSVLTVAAVLVGAACGPNYRYVYDGEVAFERCYALDYDANTPTAARATCWNQWLAYYHYGQAPDRIQYARNRVANPAEVPSAANMARTPAPASPAASPGAAPSPSMAASAPEPAPRAPAAMEARISPGGNPIAAPPPTQGTSDAMSEPPGSGCATDCRGGWGTCTGRCASAETACVARCDDAFRECMRGCY